MAKIGNLLVQDGSVTAAEVRSALRAQEHSGQRLGEVLVARGIISSTGLQRVLARQQGRNLEHEPGFGSGLRAALERAHAQRRAAA